MAKEPNPLAPTEARQMLRQMYKDVDLVSSVPRREVAQKKEQWEKYPFLFLAEALPHRFKRDPNKPAPFENFHTDMWEVTTPLENKPVLVCGFRGCGKSSLLNYGRHLYDICFNNTNYAIIGSFNEYKAKRLILPIMMELEENPMIRAVFGDLVDNRVWSNKTFVTRNNIRFEALGITQSSMGSLHNNYRPDVICLDDIITTESARSEVQSDSLLFWFWSDILPAMRPEADGGWRGWICATMVSTFSPIYKMFYHEDYQGKLIKRLYNILQEDGTPTWKKRFTKAQVNKIKKESPAFAWHGERQMPPLESTELMFHSSTFRYYEEKDLQGRQLTTIGFMDPASRTGNQNDLSALVILSIDGVTGEMFVRRGSMYARKNEDEIVRHVYLVNTFYKYMTFIFEGNGFQRLFKYIFSLQLKLKKHGPKIETVDRTGNKYLRMGALTPYLNAGMIFFLKDDPQQKEALDDMKKVAQVERKGVPDDWPDALIGAVEASQELISSLGLGAKPEDNSEEYTRKMKTPDEALRHHEMPKNRLFSQDNMASVQAITEIIQKAQFDYRESVLERRTRQALEAQKTVMCSKREYPDVRSYLFRFRDRYQEAQQDEKSSFAIEEIARLDQRYG